MAETLEAAGIPCAFFRVETFEEYLAMLKSCTSLTGRADLYEENGERIAQRIEAVKAKASAEDAHPTVDVYKRQAAYGPNGGLHPA